jgi:hypothetical protein
VLALALLAALGTAVTVAAGAGARRTDTVLDRALDELRVADVAVDVARGIIRGRPARTLRVP